MPCSSHRSYFSAPREAASQRPRPQADKLIKRGMLTLRCLLAVVSSNLSREGVMLMQIKVGFPCDYQSFAM
jgi:hypothetical protein